MKSRLSPGAAAILLVTAQAFAQSGATRPRRVNPQTTQPQAETQKQPSTTTSQRRDGSLLDVRPYGDADMTSTARAYELFQLKQYAEAAAVARKAAAKNPNDAEAYKIAGFAELGLKQYKEAATDLQRAVDLQKAAGTPDTNTEDALAQAYARAENYEKAIPLLRAATARAGATPDPAVVYLLAIAEYKTGNKAEAERWFNEVVKLNPKDAAALYYLGSMAYENGDMAAAITWLNRATVADARAPAAWQMLTVAYLRRAASSQDTAASDADYLSAVRAGESLLRVKGDTDATMLYAQALIGAKQYPKAALALERPAAGQDAPAEVLYLLGVAHSRANSFPKAIAALERARQKAPSDVNVYRELGYAYEVSKQYAKALGAYEKGIELLPNDPDFKASAERVRPFAKPPAP